MEADPRRSVLYVAQMSGCSRSTTHRILQERRLHPYHYTRVQHLRPTDYPRRVHFAQWFLRQNELNPDFSRRILFTDECSFSREGMFNAHNWHFWAHENPHLTRVRAYQERFTINLWAGIIGTTVVGPFVLPDHLNGEAYANFLRLELPALLEDVPLNVRRNMWFQHNGAPPHNSILARRTLKRVYISMLNNIQHNIMRRVRTGIEVNGDHFEHIV
ncbi:uncharacterized protein LOC135143347 [Zophobas morio]|uniref:uncharacterized protein LOC135143347 n=1 Tax=Zophobas morio TaxID=2755281 RepID=UPI0030830C62